MNWFLQNHIEAFVAIAGTHLVRMASVDSSLFTLTDWITFPGCCTYTWSCFQPFQSPETSLLLQAKAMSAFLSGEMKDTVQMNPVGAYGKTELSPSDDNLGSWLCHFQSWSDSFPGRKDRNCSAAGLGVPACGSKYDAPSLPIDLSLTFCCITTGWSRYLGKLDTCARRWIRLSVYPWQTNFFPRISVN